MGLTNVQRWRFFILWSSWKNKYESMNLALGHLQRAICPVTAEVTHLLPLLAKMSTSCACLWLSEADPEGVGLRHMKPIPIGFQRDPPLEFKKYIYKLFSVRPWHTHCETLSRPTQSKCFLVCPKYIIKGSTGQANNNVVVNHGVQFEVDVTKFTP